MRDARKFIVTRMGFATSSIPSAILPPDAIEGTCSLCGRYMPLDKHGHCNTRECREDARDTIRRIVRDQGGGNIPGLYYKFGTQEIFFFRKLERWKEPQQVKHPDMCQHGECTRWARAGDWLCRVHRLEEKLAESRERRERRQSRNKRRRQKKAGRMIGNKIKGLDRVKI